MSGPNTHPMPRIPLFFLPDPVVLSWIAPQNVPRDHARALAGGITPPYLQRQYLPEIPAGTPGGVSLRPAGENDESAFSI